MEKEYIKYDENGVYITDLPEGEVYITMGEMIKGVNKHKIISKNLVILKIEWESGRNFRGVWEKIVLPLDKALKLKELLTNVFVSFGEEVEGKHSETAGLIDADEIQIITNHDEVLDFLLNNLSTNHDYNFSFLGRIGDCILDNNLIKDDEPYNIEKEEFYALLNV